MVYTSQLVACGVSLLVFGTKVIQYVLSIVCLIIKYMDNFKWLPMLLVCKHVWITVIKVYIVPYISVPQSIYSSVQEKLIKTGQLEHWSADIEEHWDIIDMVFMFSFREDHISPWMVGCCKIIHSADVLCLHSLLFCLVFALLSCLPCSPQLKTEWGFRR